MVPLPLHVGIASADRDLRALIGPGSDFAVAWRGVRSRGISVPFEVVLHCYAYELVERLRECVAAGVDQPLHAPFWPAAMFAAGDVPVHAGDELAAMHPDLAMSWRPSGPDAIERCARELFGCMPFDPAAYPQALAQCAERGRWRQR